MSDNNKRDEGLQDYMDLLDEMAKKDSNNPEKKPSPPPFKEKKVEPSKNSNKKGKKILNFGTIGLTNFESFVSMGIFIKK